MQTHASVSRATATDLSKKYNILLISFSSEGRGVNHTGITSPVRHFFSLSPPHRYKYIIYQGLKSE